jgi:PAS domain S-box-containing protein
MQTNVIWDNCKFQHDLNAQVRREKLDVIRTLWGVWTNLTMILAFQPITAAYLVGVIISTVLTMIILKRRPAPGAQTFAYFNMIASWWILTCILEYGAVDIASKIFWAKLQCIGILSSGVVWLIFTLDYTGHSWWRRPRNVVFLSLFPLITLGIVVTNEWHRLYWPSVYLINTQFGKTAAWEHGLWFWASVAYQYSMVIVGIVLLIRFNRNKSSLQRKQLAVLIMGALMPLVFNLIYILQIKALEGFDFTPLALSISGIFYAFLIFRFHFLDVNTVARNSIVEQIPEGILVLNTNGKITDMNPAAEKIFGYTKSMMKNHLIAQVWPEFINLKTSFQPHKYKTISCKFNKRDSFMDLSLTAMFDRRGKLAGELLILRDVTEQKTVEDNLRQSEEKFSKVFHASPGAIIIANMNGTILKVNQRLMVLSNYAEEDLIGINIFDNSKLESADLSEKLGSKLEFRDTLSNIQVKLTGRSGAVHTLLCSVTSVIINSERLILISASDITEINQAHESIKRKIEIEETVTRLSSRFVGRFDYQQSVTAALGDIGGLGRASRAYLFLFNKELNEMNNSHEWCAEKVIPQIENLQNLSCDVFPWWMNELRKGKIISVPSVDELPREAAAEKAILSNQGIKSVLVFPVTIKSQLAGFIGLDNVMGAVKWSSADIAVLGTAVEIISSAIERFQAEIILEDRNAELVKSEQQYKTLYEQEKTLRSELEKESQARANFISVLTHELKTPLTPLLASMEVLSDRFGADQISIEGRLICNAMTGTTILNNRLNELLDLAKMSNGTFQFDCQLMEAGDFFQAVTKRFVPEFQKRNQLLVADVEPALPVVKLDSARLERALGYLLNNAGKSSGKGEPVILRARVDNQQLLIDIEDRGECISEDEKQRLFEPYHRMEQDRQRFSGLGLGFAITKQIIDAHGGWIELQSSQNTGNKFLIGIPLNNAPNRLEYKTAPERR